MVSMISLSALHFPPSVVNRNLFLNNLLHSNLQWSSWHRQSRQFLRLKILCRHIIRSRFRVRSWSQIWFRPRRRVRSFLQKAQGPQITDSHEEDHTAPLKKSQNFLGSVGYRAIIAKHVISFEFVAQHHLFCKERIPCDLSWRVIFFGRTTGSPCLEDSDMPFLFLIFLLNLFASLNLCVFLTAQSLTSSERNNIT